MFTDKEIEDLKERLAAFSDNYFGKVAKKAGVSRPTVARFFKPDNTHTRLRTGIAIFDAALTYIDEEERKQEMRMKKARRLIYGEIEDHKQPGEDTVRGKLDLNN